MGEAWEPPQSDAISDISKYYIGKYIFDTCMINCYYKLIFFLRLVGLAGFTRGTVTASRAALLH
jgi:hypothetical protein